jgi:hypothetical protein
MVTDFTMGNSWEKPVTVEKIFLGFPETLVEG